MTCASRSYPLPAGRNAEQRLRDNIIQVVDELLNARDPTAELRGGLTHVSRATKEWLGRWWDVLVDVEEVGRVVALLDLR